MKKCVLFVDDSESIRELVSFSLRESGFEVYTAINGADALSKIGGITVDLVLTDLNMPEMDGLTLVKELRKEEKYQYLPILILTTESEKQKRLEAKEAGATGWIIKPFDKDRLLKIISKVVR